MLRLLFPYLLFGFLTLVVVFDNVGGRSEVVRGTTEETQPCGGVAAVAEARVGRDPVCQMDVGDRLTAVLDGRRWFFCTERCRELFLEDPDSFVGETCAVCRVDDGRRIPVTANDLPFTWQGSTYRFCSAAHRDAFAGDPAGYFIHTMWGIPDWLYGISIGVVLVLSFGLFELLARWSRRRRRGATPRIDLLRIPGLLALVRWGPFRFLCQLVFVALFGLILVAGLFGNQLAARNVAPLLTWTVWWGGLVVLIMFLGKAWCYVCPWDAVAGWLEKLRFWGRGASVGLGLPWPKALRNIGLATLLFVGLTWLELGFGITMNPHATALLGLLMLTLTVAAVMVFERRAFCRYACLVGRVSGLYAMFSAVEVRPVDRDVCRSCRDKECYHGNERGEPCPTGIFPGALQQNTYCISCLECVKSCTAGNMTVHARPWGADLTVSGRPRRDEAFLALLMLAITGFHGLTMTPVWQDLLDVLEDRFGLPYLPAFSLGMAALMLGPVLVYAGLTGLSVLVARTPRVSYGRAFVAFAYSLLPIALFYHLAHNLEHLVMEGQKVIPLLSNPLGFTVGERWSVLGFHGTGEWNLFGTAGWTMAPLVSLKTLWLLQVILVLVGHVYSLWVADRTARRLYPEPGAAVRSQIPMLVGMILFSIFSLWLLKQPMEMRTSAM